MRRPSPSPLMPLTPIFPSTRLVFIRHLLERLFRGAASDVQSNDRLGGYAFTIFVALTISLYMSACLSHAQWSIYADHELRSYLVAYPKLSFSDLPSLLSQTEVGYPGELTRYRPINYLLYATEALAWGNNYFLLNIARIVGLCIFSIFLFLGFYQFFPAIVACALGALCLTSLYWKFVWIGFGVNEQYLALLGIPFTWAYVKLYSQARRGNSDMPVTWAICLASAVLLAGTKEPMVVLAPALAVLLAISLYHERKFDYRLVAAGVAIALMSAVAGVILIGLSAHGSADFYGSPVTSSERVGKLLHGIGHYPFTIQLLFGAISFGLREVARRTIGCQLSLKAIDVAAQFQIWLLLLSLSQLVFYDGWPAGNRYEFPGELFVFASFLIPLFITAQIVRARLPNLWMPYQAVIFIMAAGVATWRGYSDFRNEAAVYVERSHAFTASILKAAARAKSQPDAQIVIEAMSPYDLEPIFAVNRFLVSLGVTNPMFVRPHQLTSAVYPKNLFFQGLIDTIQALSDQGNITKDTGIGTLPGPFLARFKPFSNFSTNAPCMSVRVNNSPHEGCVTIATVTY